MKQLEVFYDYKNQLMKDLITSDRIIELIKDDGELVKDPRKFAYSQIHPYQFIPDTVEHGKTFICFDVEIRRAINKTYLNAELYIWVFTHKSKMRLPEGGVRVDEVCSEIAEMLDGSRFYGLGEMGLRYVELFAPNIEYHGKVMCYQTTDWNTQRPTGKPIPSNRKG